MMGILEPKWLVHFKGQALYSDGGRSWPKWCVSSHQNGIQIWFHSELWQMYRGSLNKHFGSHLDPLWCFFTQFHRVRTLARAAQYPSWQELIGSPRSLQVSSPGWMQRLSCLTSCSALLGAFLSLETGNPASISESLPFSAKLPQSPYGSATCGRNNLEP